MIHERLEFVRRPVGGFVPVLAVEDVDLPVLVHVRDGHALGPELAVEDGLLPGDFGGGRRGRGCGIGSWKDRRGDERDRRDQGQRAEHGEKLLVWWDEDELSGKAGALQRADFELDPVPPAAVFRRPVLFEGVPMSRCVFTLLAAVAFVTPVLSQPVNLTEKVAVGDRAKYTLELDLKGNLLVVQEGMKQPIRLEAKARHAFAERVLAVNDGLARTSARFYSEAVASAVVAGEKTERTLPADRRLIVARRKPDGLLCFAPAGPITRDDLDLVTEHFNPQCLAGLLPGKVVNIGDTWSVSDNAAQAACLFDGVIKNALAGKLTALKDGVASFTIEGTAEGMEDGAKVTLSVIATGTFDATAGRVTAIAWKQKDDREQGAVNPASEVEVSVTLKRETLAVEVKELSDEALARLPDAEVPAKFTDLRHADSKGRYRFTHSREWYVTGQTDTHLILRLIEKGEFVAQATVTVWRKVEAGKHTPADEFKKAVADTPGWVPGKTLVEGELPAGEGRWLYRTTVEGKTLDQQAVQTFYLLAGPQGDQVVVSVMMSRQAEGCGTHDAELVKAIEFGKK